MFLDTRCKRQYFNKKKPLRLRWTQAWRRANKKVKTIGQEKKKTVKKTVKVFKTFVGISIEDLKARADPQSDVRKAMADSAARKKQEKKDKPKKEKKEKTYDQGQGFVKVPKITKLRLANRN